MARRPDLKHYRGLAGVSNGKVAFRTRNGSDLSGRFPQVARALSRLVVGSAIHMWSSRVPHLGEPDWVVFDLDPGECSWEDLIKIATTSRGMLEHLNLASFPKTSGKRGLHIFVPMARGHTRGHRQTPPAGLHEPEHVPAAGQAR
ncbi:MAG: hypothetical protein M3Y59_13525 [Myxococcota bacterium]|nr:hypothetical protein [Myxococcota bacterium]